MILVRVGGDTETLALLGQEADVGHDEIDARLVVSGLNSTPQSTTIHLRRLRPVAVSTVHPIRRSRRAAEDEFVVAGVCS